MSFGFSVGDFITVIKEISHLRKVFIGAPAEFKALNDELKSLRDAVQDVDDYLSNTTLTDQQWKELERMKKNCENVVADIAKMVERYSELRHPRSIQRVWKRFKWDSEEVRGLRDRICSNTALLNGFFGRMTQNDAVVTRDHVFKLARHKEEEQHQAYLDWMSSTSYAAYQSDFIHQRQSGTGGWFLESPEFQAWVKEPRATLFCPGAPGAGKTILASVVIDELDKRYEVNCDIKIAYFYCSFRSQSGNQEPEVILASILRQLCASLGPMPDSVVALYAKHQLTGTRPSFNEISKVLCDVVEHISQTFIVIDGLDECDVFVISRVLDEIFKIQSTAGSLNFLATSRKIPDITARFLGKPSREIRATKDDVHKYLSARLEALQPSSCFLVRHVDLRQETLRALPEAVDGMFLLAQFYFDSLISKLSRKQIIKDLEGIKKRALSYDEAYDETMQRIQGYGPQRRDQAMQALQWVACATRPLTTLELLHALAIEPDESDMDEDNLPDIEDIISACAGLVVTLRSDSTRDEIIQLVHFTTQEYFSRKWTTWFPGAHGSISMACVTYLSFDAFKEGMCSNDADFETRLRQHPLFSYAARNWGHHARLQFTNDASIMSFLTDARKVDASVQALFAIKTLSDRGDYCQRVPFGFTAFHLAAYFGLQSIVQAMLEYCDQSYIKDSMDRTPLTWAAFGGHEAVVKLLISNGVDACQRDGDGRTPISLASSMGWIGVVRLLLDHHVDSNSMDIDGRTPLSWAAYQGHAKTSLLLLERGADPHTTDDLGKTPLIWASYGGFVEIIQLLLSRFVGVNTRDQSGRTALSYAAEGGYVPAVQLLLDNGATPTLADTDGSTPYTWAARAGRDVVLQVLRERCSRSDCPSNSVDNILSPNLTALTRDPLPRRGDFQCPLCQETDRPRFRHLANFKRHIMGRHYDSSVFICPEPPCRKRFWRVDNLRSHVQRLHKETEYSPADGILTRPHPRFCPICQESKGSWKEFYSCVVDHGRDLGALPA